MKNKKTKPENLGLGDGSNLGFGFEKSLGYPVSGLDKPELQTLVLSNRAMLFIYVWSVWRVIQ